MKPLSEVAICLLIIHIQILAVCKDWICFHQKIFHPIVRQFAQMSHDLVILSLFEWNGAHDKFLGWSQGLLFLLPTFCASNLGSFFTLFRIPIENTFRVPSLIPDNLVSSLKGDEFSCDALSNAVASFFSNLCYCFACRMWKKLATAFERASPLNSFDFSVHQVILPIKSSWLPLRIVIA